MKELKPMLFTSMKSYSKEKLIKDIIAGIIVAIIALPLSIALALASGVGPQEGIYTAIVAGFIISLLGGSTVQIAGPTAAFATIVAGVVAKNGMDGLVVATVLAGVFLVLMGVLKMGSLIKYIPYTITTGFTAGIAVTILIGQFKDFFGLEYKNPIETVEKLEAFFHNISAVNIEAVIVGVVSLAILIVWPYINKKIPGSLIAVLVGSFMAIKMNVATIGNTFTLTSSLPKFTLPSFSIELVKNVLPDAFTIAILAAIESLLSCVVADSMTNTKHRSNAELVAQGVGNMGSALFGGIPATGAIARTAANIKNGGNSPIAGMVHAVVLLLVLVFLIPYAGFIPMPTIAAILFMVAYNMSHWRPFVRLIKTAPKSDIAVLVLTFILTVVFDLVIAIEVGFLLTCLLFMKRMSDETSVIGWKYAEEDVDDSEKLQALPKEIRVYEITGPLFFGAVDTLANIKTKEFTKCLIVRMRSVPAIDITAMNSLNELYATCEEKGIKLIFSHVNEQPLRVMEKAGFIEKIGRQNFCDHIDGAIALAKTEVNEQ